jgi:hypothetical protein
VANADFVSDILESILLLESSEISTAFPVNIEEAMVLDSSFIGGLLRNAYIEENLSVNQSQDAERFVYGLMVENTVVAYIVSAQGTYPGTIAEQVGVSYDAVFAYLWNPIPDTAQGNFQAINTTSVPIWGAIDTAVNANFSSVNTAVNADFESVDTASTPNFRDVNTI